MDSADLGAIRAEIDKLDEAIWSLLKQRFTLMAEVSRIKKEANLPILDSEREEKVLRKICSFETDPQTATAISKIYELLFALSRECQHSYFKPSD